MLIFGFLTAMLMCAHAFKAPSFSQIRRSPRLLTSLLATGNEASNDLQSWRVVELQEECRKRGLKVRGSKDELIARLEGPPPSKFESMELANLRVECASRSLDSKGKKSELVARLEEWEAKEATKVLPPPPPRTNISSCLKFLFS